MQIVVNGLSTRFELEGPEHAPVVMLSHSLALNLTMWRPQMAELARRYRVLRYDTRGHGDTQAPTGPFTLADLAQDACTLLDLLHIERVHWVGLSMGGMIGQQLAVTCPERLHSLVLANTLSAYGPEHEAMWLGRIQAASTAAGIEPLVEPTVTRWFTETFRETHPLEIAWIRQEIRRTSAAGFQECCRALMALNLTSLLPRVQTPALVIAGRQDPSTPVTGSELIARTLPHARLEILDPAAHISNVEQPLAFQRALLDFLDEQDGPGQADGPAQ